MLNPHYQSHIHQSIIHQIIQSKNKTSDKDIISNKNYAGAFIIRNLPDFQYISAIFISFLASRMILNEIPLLISFRMIN